MKPSELLIMILGGANMQVRELGRLLDSLMRLAGPGSGATRAEAGLVRLANDGESSGEMAVRANDGRLTRLTDAEIAGRIITGV